MSSSLENKNIYSSMLHVLSSSESAAEFLENLIEDDLLGKNLKGAALYSFDDVSEPSLLAACGKSIDQSDDQVNISALNRFIELVQNEAADGSHQRLMSIQSEGKTVGAMSLILHQNHIDSEYQDVLAAASVLLGDLLRFWIASSK